MVLFETKSDKLGFSISPSGGHRMTTNGGVGQDQVFDFFQNDERFTTSGPVKRFETHGAVVFLIGKDAYKIKRAVRYAFMDFSTLEKRRAACEAEMKVNRENAPQLYLETLPIVRRKGALELGGEGEIVEWAVHLRRFDESSTFDRLAASGSLDFALIDKLCREVERSHHRARKVMDSCFAGRLRGYFEDAVADLRGAAGLWADEAVDKLRLDMQTAFERREDLMTSREKSGFVRHCHGDLHLGNIALVESQPVLFDAIEFDERLATVDVLYDLAFVLMDLWERRAFREANRLFNRYLEASADVESQLAGLALLPLFLSLRAAIRASVTLRLSQHCGEDERLRARARSYFAVAKELIRTPPPLLLAVGGFSGAGKSVLAAELAPFVGRAPGAVVLRSDVVRKRQRRVDELERLPPDAYAPEATARVYERLHELGAAALKSGQAVVLDATHLSVARREAAAALAAAAHVPFQGFWLMSPMNVLRMRLAARGNDVSDATADTLEAQTRVDVGPISWPAIRADRPVRTIVSEALRLLDLPDRSEG
jgi:aminoglycoside phosphotransferase family enzyme/predicted kinase